MKTERLFEVNPLGIDRSKFEQPMNDWWQERAREIILEAFAEVDKHPEKYVSAFYTLVPEKKWDGYKTAAELTAYAEDLGGQMADWVEFAMELAQRISNGESWENICNNFDTAEWYRMIIWKNGCYRWVGGSRYNTFAIPASHVDFCDRDSTDSFCNNVPLVVIKNK